MMIVRISQHEAKMLAKKTTVIRVGQTVGGRVQILQDKGKKGWMPIDPVFQDEGQFDHCRHVKELSISEGSDFCVAKVCEGKKGAGIIINKHGKRAGLRQCRFYWLEPAS